MKKYITVAALLAAGTAFANAADIDAKVILNFNDQSLTNSVAGSGATVAQYGDAPVYTNGSYVTDSGYSFEAKGGLTNGIKISNAISWSSNFTLSFATKITDPVDYQNLFIIGDSSKYLLFQVQNDDASTIKFAGNVSSISGGVTLSSAFSLLTMVYTAEDRLVSMYKDGEYAASAKVNDDVTSAETSTDIYLGKAAAGNSLAGYFDEVAVYDGALSQTQIQSHLVGKSAPSSIPEPSAFGLLAGIGALALVASRRRRK